MTKDNKEIDLHDIQGNANIEVAEALSNAFECFSIFTEGKDKLTISESILLSAWALIYQMSVEFQKVNIRLDDIQESIDCAGVIVPAFWMQSEVAAKKKAEELGIEILPEYSMADLRYLIDCKIKEVI